MMTRVIWGSGPRSFLSQACRADRASKRACWIGIPTLYSLAPSPHRCHIIPGGTPGRPDAARLGFSDLSRSGLSAPQVKRGPVAAPTSAPQGKRGGERRVIMSFTVGRWNREATSWIRRGEIRCRKTSLQEKSRTRSNLKWKVCSLLLVSYY